MQLAFWASFITASPLERCVLWYLILVTIAPDVTLPTEVETALKIQDQDYACWVPSLLIWEILCAIGLWYFIVLQSLGATEHGVWKAIGEHRKIFSNDSICGWRTTYRFCDQQPPNTSRADWLMEEYTISQNGMDLKIVREDTNALCRVLRKCPASFEHDLQQSHGAADILHDKPGNSTDSPDFNYHTSESEASTVNRQVNNIEAVLIVAIDNPINQENLPYADWEDFPRDHLEINHLLDIAPPPSSSSSNCDDRQLCIIHRIIRQLYRGRNTDRKEPDCPFFACRQIYSHWLGEEGCSWAE